MVQGTKKAVRAKPQDAAVIAPLPRSPEYSNATHKGQPLARMGHVTMQLAEQAVRLQSPGSPFLASATNDAGRQEGQRARHSGPATRATLRYEAPHSISPCAPTGQTNPP